MTNEELLQQYLEGGEATFGALCQSLSGLVRAVALACMRKLGILQPGDRLGAYQQDVLEEMCSEGWAVVYGCISGGTYDLAKGKLTTYLYPFLWGAMWHYGKEQAARRAHTVSLWDFEEGEEYLLADPGEPADRAVYRKVCIELLGELFGQLSEKDRAILGSCFGVFGFSKLTLEEIAFRELLTVDGVIRAKKAALGRLRRLYEDGSRLRGWREVWGMVRRVQG